MGEDVKMNQNQNQNYQKNFTQKNKSKENTEEIKTEAVKEIADTKFNSAGVNKAEDTKNFKKAKDFSKETEAVAEFKADIKVEPKVEPKIEAKVENKVENKVEVKPEPKIATQSDFKGKISGEVVSVSDLSYIVKTKEGNGVLVTGKHNKKIGDKI